MTTFRCRGTTLGFSFAVALLALQGTPAAAADCVDSSTATIERGRTLVFSDVYAFRAQDRDDKKKQVTVVILGVSPLDKKAMTAALKKERDASAAMTIANLAKMGSAVFWIEQSGKIGNFGVFIGGMNQCLGRDLKSDVKLNTVKRVEGRVSDDDKRDTGQRAQLAGARVGGLHWAPFLCGLKRSSTGSSRPSSGRADRL